MPDGVTVETNWIHDIALQRDEDSSRLWRLAIEGELEVCLPVICLAESVKWLESQLRLWRRLVGDIHLVAGELRRSALLIEHASPLEQAEETLAAVQDGTRRRLWSVLHQLGDSIHQLETTPPMITHAAIVEEQLELSPADALVLATVIDSRATDAPSNFMSRDKKAFDRPDVRRYLAERGIAYFSDARSFIRTIRQA